MFKGLVNEWTDCKREVRDKMEKKREEIYL